MANRKKGQRLHTDDQLNQLTKNNDHKRQERMKEAISWIVLVMIVLAAVILPLWIVGFVIHKWIIGDMATVQRYLEMSVSGVVGYIVAYLKYMHEGKRPHL